MKTDRRISKRSLGVQRLVPSTGALSALLLVLTACAEEPPGLSGTIEYEQVELRAFAFEPISEIAVRQGDSVVVGQRVLVQEATTAEITVEQASAALEAARARLAAAERGPRAEQVEQARAQLAAAHSRERESQAELARQERLFGDAVVPRQALDQAIARRDANRAELQRARQALDELENGSTREELDEAKAVVAQARAQLAAAERGTQQLEISAPVSGIVDTVLVDVGDRPAPGETVAILLSPPSFVRFYLPQDLRAQIEVGTKVNVEVDGRAKSFEATVRWIALQPTFTPFFALNERDRKHLSYLAEAEFTTDPTLPAGFPVQVEVEDQASSPEQSL